MEKYFFILGRNPELSKEEVKSFLDARKRAYTQIFFEGNLLVLEVKEGEAFKIQEFGGVLHLGKIIFEGDLDLFEVFLDKDEIIPSDKFSYQAFGNGDIQIIKEKFKREKKKATQKHGRNQITFQDGEKRGIAHTDFSIFLHQHKGNTLFGTTTQDYDYKDIKNRDMHKPVRRESLAISPRLSKILINLSEAKSGVTMLDPFCGVGGIMQEAVLKGISVYGIDKDKTAIASAKENFLWLKKQYGINVRYSFSVGDSRKTPDNQFGAIATETPLGKLLKKKPNDNQAEQSITNFEAFIIPILRRLRDSKKKEAKIAITFPVIRKFHVDVSKIAEKTALKVHKGPIHESRKDQFVSRDIIVFK